MTKENRLFTIVIILGFALIGILATNISKAKKAYKIESSNIVANNGYQTKIISATQVEFTEQVLNSVNTEEPVSIPSSTFTIAEDGIYYSVFEPNGQLLCICQSYKQAKWVIYQYVQLK